MNVRTNTSLLARPGLSAVNPAVLPAIAPDFWAKQLKKSAPDSVRKTRDPHSEKKRELNDLVSRSMRWKPVCQRMWSI
jgi:hypothetical protein